MAQSGREASKYAVFTKYAHTAVQQHIKNARLTCALHAGCTEGGGGAGEVLGGARDGLGGRRGLRGLRGGAGVQALHAKLKLRLQPSRDRPAAPSALESGSTAGTAGLASAPAMAEAEETRETVWDSAEVVLSLVCECSGGTGGGLAMANRWELGAQNSIRSEP